MSIVRYVLTVRTLPLVPFMDVYEKSLLVTGKYSEAKLPIRVDAISQ